MFSTVLPHKCAAIFVFSIITCGSQSVLAGSDFQFEELCKTVAGTKIFMSVKNVNGVSLPRSDWNFSYADAGVLGLGYEFVEIEFRKSNRPSYKTDRFISEFGKHKYHLAEFGDPKCDKFTERLKFMLEMSHTPLSPSEKDQMIQLMWRGKCLAVEKVSEFTAPFRVYWSHVIYRNREKHPPNKWQYEAGDIIHATKRYENARTGDVLAEFNLVRLVKSVQNGRRKYSKSCPERAKNAPPKLLTDVLVPSGKPFRNLLSDREKAK